jgi:hypothetical protein
MDTPWTENGRERTSSDPRPTGRCSGSTSSAPTRRCPTAITSPPRTAMRCSATLAAWASKGSSRSTSIAATRSRPVPELGEGQEPGLSAALTRRSSCQRSIKRAMACRREGISPCVLAQPGRPASSGSVMVHSQGLGSRGAVVMCRTPPMMRPSKRATPSVPGSEPGRFAAR